MTDSPRRRSGLSDDEIYDLWIKYSTQRPALFRLYFDGKYQTRASEEEQRSNDSALKIFIHEQLPDIEHYPGHHRIYTDMKEFLSDPRMDEFRA